MKYSDDQEDVIVYHSPVLEETDEFFFVDFTRLLPFCSKLKREKTNLLIEKKQERIIYPGGQEMLKPLLEEFLKLEGVSAAVVVGRDGFVIESAVSGKVDIEALGAMASTGLGTSEAMGKTLGKGELSQMLVELEKGPIILSPLSVDELIAIVADTTANIGRIRYELKKNKERLIAAL